MEKIICERNTVLGMTTIAMLLMLGMAVMPSMAAAPQSDLSLGFSAASAAWAAYNNDVVGALMSLGGYELVLAAAAIGGLTGGAALVVFL